MAAERVPIPLSTLPSLIDTSCVQVSSNMLTAVQGPVNAANAIVSYYPEFEGFGEFIRNGKFPMMIAF